MRLEMYLHTKSLIEKSGLINRISPVMDEGEILLCQAVDKQGDTVLLKNRNGNLFAARMLDGVEINSGDNVRLTVSSAEGDHRVLKVIDIFPETTSQEANVNAEGYMEGTARSARILSSVLPIIKQNPNILPKLAYFLASNRIAATSENTDTLTGVHNGNNKMGSILNEILTNIQRENIESSDRQLDGYSNSRANKQHADVPVGGEKPINPDKDENIKVKTEEESEHRTFQPDNEDISVLIKDTKIKAGEKGELKTFQADNEDTSVLIKDTKTKVGEKSELKTFQPDIEDTSALIKDIKEKVEKQILKLFVDIKTNRKGEDFKPEVIKIPEKLKTLKLLLNNDDIKDKEVLAEKAALLEQQIKVMSQIKKIACFQIPISFSEQRNTAELFVYKHKGGKNKKDADKTVVLVGLDTQNAGRIEALISVSSKNLSVQFGLEKSEVVDAVNENKAKLVEAVGSAGFVLKDVQVKLLDEKTTVLNAEEKLFQKAGRRYENIDVRI